MSRNADVLSSPPVALTKSTNTSFRSNRLDGGPYSAARPLLVHHHDSVIVHDCIESMSYSQKSCILEPSSQHLLDEGIRLTVD